MKNLYVVRHCKAEGQAPDAPLTAAGVLQAEKLADFLADKNIDSIIASPFERACRTLAPLAEKLGVDIMLDERLTERVLLADNHPDWRDMLLNTFDDLDLRYEGGESSNAAMNRAIGVVREALNSKHNNIALVSHGNLISLLLKHFDDRIGFREWESMSNPDVFHLSFVKEMPSIHRIWAD
ncbi:histidine phosphatase family protein [Paenibacillus montanisoli]|uniref:Histidine phosphatase family protein n=1 Tax=Paenibacillus montanisoli TaxID=2081970 RepID=A0A328TUV8_9BACL|nr:histidine phosphatase family protein [Paenibacillus montanisoli]RAP74328.1 histidine phosphatase family protein [Paenibacillus montanisoli]